MRFPNLLWFLLVLVVSRVLPSFRHIGFLTSLKTLFLGAVLIFTMLNITMLNITVVLRRDQRTIIVLSPCLPQMEIPSSF